MRTSRALFLTCAAVLIVGAGSAGCSPRPGAAPQTVLVTVTAGSAQPGPTDTQAVTVAPLPTTTATAPVSISGSESSSAGDTTSSASSPGAAPVVTVDPLKADCSRVMNNTALGAAFGQLPPGTNRILEGRNSARKITGRLKCQYGVSEDKSTVAVQVVLAQFESAEAAAAQTATTVSQESALGAKESTTTVQGHPATVLLRDGGLLIVGYGTWTLSVVVDKSILSDDKLPAALQAAADYALMEVITLGG